MATALVTDEELDEASGAQLIEAFVAIAAELQFRKLLPAAADALKHEDEDLAVDALNAMEELFK